MISGQTIEADEPTDAACSCRASSCLCEGKCNRKPARDFMLSGWPDSITLCELCSAKLRRLELDLTRDCALCGGPIQRHATNGRISDRRCSCTGRKNPAKSSP